MVYDPQISADLFFKYPNGSIYTIIGSFLVFLALYNIAATLLSQIFNYYNSDYYKLVPEKKDRANFESRFVSTAHAIYVTYGSTKCFLQVPLYTVLSGNVHLITPSPEERIYWLCITAGYFIYDFLICLRWPNIGDFPTIFHHIVGILSFLAGIYYDFGTYVQIGFMMSEASTPFLNIRWVCMKLDYGESQLCTIVTYIFGFIFLIYRVVINAIIFFTFNINWAILWGRYGASLYLFEVICGFAFLFVNLFWFITIIKMALAKSKHKKKVQEKTS